VGLLTHVKAAANRLLSLANMRLDSLTAERAEINRLLELERRGHFDKAVFPVLPQFTACDPSPIFQQIRHDESGFAKLVDAENANAFPLKNDYYTTPDAEVLYAIVQLYRPARIVEVGSGNSTHLFRLAVKDAGLGTHITSIDPHPRRDIGNYSDVLVTERVEDIQDLESFQRLRQNDILFIDSSHEIKAGNDLLHLVFTVLPCLAAGVLIHFHDIFLPYEYPREWVVENRWNWTEQYLVQAFLTRNDSFDVLWPGYYLQRTRPNFETEFNHWSNSIARSLWLQKR
jgi:predicted O-methyltransferase YrrM